MQRTVIEYIRVLDNIKKLVNVSLLKKKSCTTGNKRFSWKYNARNIIFFSVSKVSFVYLTLPTDFTNDQKTMRGVTWGYIYTLTTNIRIEDNTWNIIIFTIIQDTFAKLSDWKIAFIKKRTYNLVNDGNY